MGEPVTDPAELEKLNGGPARKGGREPVTDPAQLQELEGGIPGVKVLRSRTIDPRSILESDAATPRELRHGYQMPGTMEMGGGPRTTMGVDRPALPAMRMQSTADWNGLGILPPEQTVSGDIQTPDLTEQQQRLAEFARIARAPEGGPNLAAMAAGPIGRQPTDPYEDEKLAGRAIWQLKNKGGTYDPNYTMGPLEWAKDLHDSFMSKTAEGITLLGGLPGTLERNKADINEYFNRKLGFSDEAIAAQRKKDEADEARARETSILPDIGEVRAAAERWQPGSTSYQPATTGGRYAGAVGSALGMGGPAGGFVRGVIAPAVAYQAGLDLTGGNEGIALGASLLSPLALKTLTTGGGRLLSPFGGRVDAARQQAADVLRREGLNLTAGDVTGSTMLKRAEEELGGGAYMRDREAKLEQLTEASLRRVTANPPNRAGAPELNTIAHNIGQVFEGVGRRNVVNPTPRFGHALGNAWRRYVSDTTVTGRVQRVQDTIQELITAGRANVPASRYQAISSELKRSARSTADPVLKRAYNEMAVAVDDAIETSLARSGSADLGAYRTARRQWRNFLAIEDAMTGASTETNLGLITPPMLAKGVRMKHGKTSVARGRGDLSELARASNALLRDIANSGTAGRLAVRRGAAAAGGAAGIGAGAVFTGQGFDDPASYMRSGVLGGLGAIGGAALPYAIGRGILSPLGRRYLANQARPGQWLINAGQRQGGWRLPLLFGTAGVAAPSLYPAQER